MENRIFLRGTQYGRKHDPVVGNLQGVPDMSTLYGLYGFAIENYAFYGETAVFLPANNDKVDPNAKFADCNGQKFLQLPVPKADALTAHDAVPGDLCLACEELDLPRLLTFVAGRKAYLGWFEDIANCTCCSLCRLLTEAFKSTIETRQFTNLQLSTKTHYLFITTYPAALPLPQRRKDRPQELDVWLVNVNGLTKAELKIRLLVDSAVAHGKTARFHGRKRDLTGADFSLARQWIGECLGGHERETTLEQRKRITSLTLVDVYQHCLIEAGFDVKYAALSYVWPLFKSSQLVKSNFNQLHTPGFLRDSSIRLPKVILDAEEIVKKLGLKYLWVDALCIVQDDPTLKDDLIGAMDLIYGGAYFTIVVATRTSPKENYSIPGVNGQQRRVPQLTAEVDGLEVVVALPTYEDALQSSVWSTRGWTFQEGILSKRCLIFTDFQMYFRCAHDSRCEDVEAEGSEIFDYHAAKPAARQGQLDYITNDGFLKKVSENTSFHEYALLASAYSSRKLTFETDILNAFRGIMQGISSFVSPSGFYMGLPMDHFDAALLWYPTSQLKMRQSISMEKKIQANLPSWSWISWAGKVAYELDSVSLPDQEAMGPFLIWWRLHNGTLIPVKPHRHSSTTSFTKGLLAARAKGLSPMHLLCFGICVKLLVHPEEQVSTDWVTDYRQTLPCFCILDHLGDVCGMLYSENTDWVTSVKARRQIQMCEFLLMSAAFPSLADTTFNRARLYHPKYKTESEKGVCYYNIMLIHQGVDGVYTRRGIGRIHRDAVDDQFERDWERKIIVLF